MNAFYKEQKKLMQKAFTTLLGIEAIEEAAAEMACGFISMEAQKAVRESAGEKLESLKTDYALTVTTLMQNFCSQMGFTLIRREEFDEAEIIS